MKAINFLLVLAYLPLFSSCNEVNQAELKNSTENEIFKDFFIEFSSDKQFQLSRIQFPLEYISLNEELDKEIKDIINKESWSFINTGLDVNSLWLQTYDNFQFKNDKSDYKVVEKRGFSDGVEEYFYFKRIKGKWYLIKWEDLST
jgi:hypothetical protein